MLTHDLELLAMGCFNGLLVGTIPDHVRVFRFASWLTAASGDGALETSEVAVPSLVPRIGARVSGLTLHLSTCV